MSNIFKHHAVNWIDGMKLSGHHFLQDNAHVYELLQDATALLLTPNIYGLLAPDKGQATSLNLEVRIPQGSQAKVVLKHCNAVTRKGGRIVANSDFLPQGELSTLIPAEQFKGQGSVELAVI